MADEMNTDKGSSLGDEVERRLDDLFMEAAGEEEETSEAGVRQEREPKSKSGNSNLMELKTIIMSIEWEINDQIMTRLMKEAEALMANYKDDRVVFMLLRLLGSIGKYIKTHKAKAHPMAVNMLNSIYSNLEKIISSEGITRKEKENILVSQVSEFKKLKAKISKRKESIDKEKPSEIPVAETPPFEQKEEKEEEEVVIGPDQVEGVFEEGGDRSSLGMDSGLDLKTQEAINTALEEVKKVIKAEFEALRTELKQLMRQGY